MGEAFCKFKINKEHITDLKQLNSDPDIMIKQLAVRKFTNVESHSKIIDFFSPELNSQNAASALLEIIKFYDEDHYNAMNSQTS